MSRFEGKAALVTGGAQGIGRGIAELAVERFGRLDALVGVAGITEFASRSRRSSSPSGSG